MRIHAGNGNTVIESLRPHIHGHDLSIAYFYSAYSACHHLRFRHSQANALISYLKAVPGNTGNMTQVDHKDIRKIDLPRTRVNDQSSNESPLVPNPIFHNPILSSHCTPPLKLFLSNLRGSLRFDWVEFSTKHDGRRTPSCDATSALCRIGQSIHKPGSLVTQTLYIYC